jgi:hypothetical protein
MNRQLRCPTLRIKVLPIDKRLGSRFSVPCALFVFKFGARFWLRCSRAKRAANANLNTNRE